jgi:uridine kinase
LKQIHPIVIGISGISGAGKSTLTKRLAETLQATFLFWDDYDEISQGPGDYVKWYETSKNCDDWVYDDLATTLEKLKEGQKVICPATKRELFPTDYILFDAPMGYCHRATGKYIDFLICLDTPLDIALARRLLRDYRTHPDPQKMLGELDYYLSDSRPLFIMTTEEKVSDLIIDGSLPVDSQEQEVLKVLDNIIHKKRTS